MRYVSTVTAPGFARFMIRIAGSVIAAIDIPAGPSATADNARWLAHRWLMGEVLPDSVRLWAAP